MVYQNCSLWCLIISLNYKVMFMVKLKKYKNIQKGFYAILFVLVVVAIGGAIGAHFTPTSWYQDLNKPFYTPPNCLFAPVWFVLYVLCYML